MFPPPPASGDLPQFLIEVRQKLGEVSRSDGGVLPSLSNSRGMFLRQTCLTNALLHFRNVVGNPARFPRLGGTVVNRIRSPWVTVAQLTHRTRVGDQPWL